MKFRTITADPPWPQPLLGKYKLTRHSRPDKLPYPTMSLDDIKALPVQQFTDDNAHLWLWTTNAFLRQGFDVLDAWGFKYLAPITWIKPSGFGNYFLHRTQTILFGYRGKCIFRERFKPNIIMAPARRHSQKPECSYELIEQVSFPPYLELFARHRHNEKWRIWGNEVESDIEIRKTPKDNASLGVKLQAGHQVQPNPRKRTSERNPIYPTESRT